MMHFPFESTNRALFLAINAPADLAGVSLSFAMMASNYLVFLLAALLLWTWIRRRPFERRWLLTVAIAALLALSLNTLIGMLAPHPRPFMVPIGHTFIPHDPEASFPSDHATLMWTFAWGLYWLPALRRIGYVAIVLAAFTSWGRVFLGVHFPFDMVGSMVVAVISLMLVRPWQPWIDARLSPLAERVHVSMFGKWLK